MWWLVEKGLQKIGLRVIDKDITATTAGVYPNILGYAPAFFIGLFGIAEVVFKRRKYFSKTPRNHFICGGEL